MQYTLPLNEKQIEQTKLEAEARKEVDHPKRVSAEGEAKVIDSKAELHAATCSRCRANRIKWLP